MERCRIWEPPPGTRYWSQPPWKPFANGSASPLCSMEIQWKLSRLWTSTLRCLSDGSVTVFQHHQRDIVGLRSILRERPQVVENRIVHVLTGRIRHQLHHVH